MSRQAGVKSDAKARPAGPAADGRLPDFDVPGNLIGTAVVRSSLDFERGLAEAEKPKSEKRS